MVRGNAYTEYLMLLLMKRPTPLNLSIGLHWYSKEYPEINKVLADSSSSHVSETARISMFKMYVCMYVICMYIFFPIPIVLLQPKTITIMQHNYISEKSGNNGKPKRYADPAN